MSRQQTIADEHLILGLGATGLSVAHYLSRCKEPFAILDTRSDPPGLEAFKLAYPYIRVYLGPLDAELLSSAKTLIVSPGVSLAEPALRKAKAAGVELLSDVELFCRAVATPILAITGSNAKSTVTTLVGEMAKAAGLKVGVGGNIGLPVLDLLHQGQRDLYVLELSSFQLESVSSLAAQGASILNISEDHLDRYDGMPDYIAAKKRVYNNAQQVIFNRADKQTQPRQDQGTLKVSFGLDRPPGSNDFGLLEKDGSTWIARGEQLLQEAKEVPLIGQQGLLNVMASYALAAAADLPITEMRQAVASFQGLPHRCQWVAKKQGVDFINDSKATNLGAALAAIQSLEQQYARVWLILGGEGKGQDFSLLTEALGSVAGVALIGRDASLIAKQLPPSLPCWHLETLDEAVEQLFNHAATGDAVLLAPACASFDQFDSYAQRGEVFIRCVQRLPD